MKIVLLAILSLSFGLLSYENLFCSGVGVEFPSFLCNPSATTAISHLASNAFYLVNPHPILNLLLPVLPAGGYFILLAIWFVSGSLLVRPSIDSAIFSIGILLLFLSLFGADTSVFHLVVGVPWIIWSVRLVIEDYKYGSVILFATSALHAITALQSSIIGVFFVLLFANRNLYNSQALNLKNILFLVAPSLFALFFTSVPIFPDYPSFSRVLYEIYPHREPWFGESPKVALINLPLLSKVLFIPSSIGFFFALLFFIKERFNLISSATLIIFLGLLIETLFFNPDSGGEISPISSIVRIFPGFSFLPIHTLMFGFGTVLIALMMPDKIKLFVLILITLIFVSRGYPILSAGKIDIPQLTPNIQKILNSPSAVMLRENNDLIRIIETNSFKSKYRSYPINKLPHSIEASHQNEIIKRIFMGESSKRWSPMKGKQEGGEFIRIKLDLPHHIKGIQLSPGAFHGDYMRGVRIRILDKCATIEEAASGKVIYEKNPFEGDIAWTSDGYPFYESPSKGIFHFNEDIMVQCIMIEQIGSTPYYDWSVSNIRYLQ